MGKNKTTITIEWMTKIQMLLKEGAEILRDTAEYFTDGALNIPLKAPRRCFSYGFCPLNVCKIINSVLCYLKDQGITKIMFRLHPGHEGSFCFVHGRISKSQYNAGVQCGLVQCMLVSFLSWRKLVQEISRNSSSG